MSSGTDAAGAGGTTGELRAVSLDDKYTLDAGRVLISGNQALVRLLLLRGELDRKAGLNTAGFVSGYRGSPLGGLDLALWAARKRLEAANIVFQPGVNEDLAATTVWGTQQLRQFRDATVDGVYGMWYAKGPGVDRAGDPIKHGNYAGTHPNGGVIAVFGDDHPGKSSTIAHHSEQMFAGHSIPVLYPAGVGEFISFGLLGYELSRYSGCWVGMKVVNETIEQTSTIDFDLGAFAVERPDRADLMPPEGVNYRGGFAPQLDESILVRYKLPLAQRFARANRLDRVALGETGRFGIVTAGKSYQDTMQALRYLGIDDARARALGVSVYKVGMIWPLEPVGLREFAQGKAELFFIEEKAAFVEPQAAALLYNEPVRPRIVGKLDEHGTPLVSLELLLEPVDLAMSIAARLRANGIWDAALEERLAATQSYRRALLAVTGAGARRLPFFCSGCPHNTSTAVPEGSQAISGIGCHGMAIWAKPGTTLVGTQMGGEGMNWVGLHRFTKTKHMFQNLGDGTYYHSGLLAIRAAVASGANVTYKILYNDAVAMTGGQPVDGPISVGQIAHQVLSEGVKKVVLVTDDPSRYASGAGLPAGLPVVHRDQLDGVQRELREIPGATALIYEQTCAAEKRRRRKRGQFPDPDKRMFIHDAVCEGCGDCSTQSGCVSIEPKETALGRKRRINQSTCNKDYSCVKGFCPSFVTVYGGQPRRPQAVSVAAGLFDALPVPAVAPLEADGYGVMIAGIGGTGVITVGAVLAMAAHLEGHAASAYDMTGLSQKNGAVFSHLRLAQRPEAIASQRLGLGDASLVLGFDMVSALSDEAYRTLSPERSRFLGNDRVQPTAMLNFNPDDRVDTAFLQRKIREKLAEERVGYVDATGIAVALCGDSIATNLFMVGVASQRGWLPVSAAAIERAIELNGVQIELNKRAFAFGRLWVHDPAAVAGLLGGALPASQAPVAQDFDALVDERRRLLTDYQDAAYAQRYASLVARVVQAEEQASPGSRVLSTAVARHAAKLMAYKDEYEVARLYSDPSFLDTLKAEFEGEVRLAFNLAPPMFAQRDPKTGRLMKREYGPWMLTAFGWLAKLRFLRGGALDVFGRTDERRMERALIGEYERTILDLLPKLGAGNLAAAVALAEVPERIRGFGHVKEQSVAQAAALRTKLLAEFAAAGTASAAPAPVAQKAA
jgi:indolepyruvate ferredoxin oxidoreductase